MQNKSLDKWIEDEIPPIDVLMVWHSYMLNPTWYAEDCDRNLKKFKTLDDRLLAAIVSLTEYTSSHDG